MTPNEGNLNCFRFVQNGLEVGKVRVGFLGVEKGTCGTKLNDMREFK